MKYILTFLLSISVLHAAQVDFIDNDTYTTDTISGLNWLDVTTTVGLSKNHVLGELGTGGDYAGYRYATGTEFMTMMDNYHGDRQRDDTTQLYYTDDSSQWLIDTLGSTLDSYYVTFYGKTYDDAMGYSEGEYADYQIGLLADTYSSTRSYVAMINNSTINSDYWDIANNYTQANDYEQVATGSYLVRATTVETPIPAAIWLMGSGIAGLLGFGRKKSVAV